MPTIEAARLLAEQAHAGQKYGERPYIVHPADVAARVADHGPNAVMAAWLHDVVEDTPITLDDLRREGFPDHVVEAVDAVTRRSGETYMQFVHRAAEHPLGRIIKLADNASNTAKLDDIPDPATRNGLRRRYTRARRILLSAEQAGQR